MATKRGKSNTPPQMRLKKMTIKDVYEIVSWIVLTAAAWYYFIKIVIEVETEKEKKKKENNTWTL